VQKIIIRFLAEPEREDVFGLHPADSIKSKTMLANKPGVDDEYRTMHLAYVASVRERAPGSAGVSFEAWLSGVADVEILRPPAEIDDLEASGAFNEVPGMGDVMRARWARYADSSGESLAPRD